MLIEHLQSWVTLVGHPFLEGHTGVKHLWPLQWQDPAPPTSGSKAFILQMHGHGVD